MLISVSPVFSVSHPVPCLISRARQLLCDCGMQQRFVLPPVTATTSTSALSAEYFRSNTMTAGCSQTNCDVSVFISFAQMLSS